MGRVLSFLVAALVVSGVAACGSPTARPSDGAAAPAAGGSTASGQTVTVRGTDMLRFEPASLTVKAGQPVQLTFTNAGQMPHDWSLAQGAVQPVRIVAAPGQSATGTFTIDRPGTYTFICSVPGHEAGGMKGTLTAQ